MNYYIKCYDYFLEEITYTYNVITDEIDITDFKFSKDLRKLFNNYEEAEQVRRNLFIETGLNLVVKRFKRKEE